MISSKCSPWLSSVVLAVCLLAAGCATNRRELFLQEKASGYVLHKPLGEVWPQVRSMLRERDLPMREVAGGFEIATDWWMQGAPSSLGTSYVRYYVRGKHPSPETCVVEIFRQNRTTQGTEEIPTQNSRASASTETNSMTRDRELEWELLQRVEPETARALRAEAEATIK